MNVTLAITDTYCSSCYKNTIEKEITFNSRDISVELQNSFYLNVLEDNSNSCCIMIQNGENVILRQIQNNTETSILIPSSCSHILTLKPIE